MSQRGQASEQFGGRRRFKEIFRDAHGGREHAGIGIIEGTLDGGDIERAETFERPERVQTGERRGRGGDDCAQGGRSGGVAALDEETLRGVAHPAVGVGETGDEGGGVRCREAGIVNGLRRAFGDDTVNTAERNGLFQITRFDLGAQVAGDVSAMLNEAAVEVGDVERAIGAVDEINRTEAFVGRGDELGAFVGVATFHGAVGGCDRDALDEITGGFADEGVAGKFFGK